MTTTKYVFGLIYLRHKDGESVKFEEFVVAETWEQAREYWKLEFVDQGVEVLEMKRHIPVLAILTATESKGELKP